MADAECFFPPLDLKCFARLGHVVIIVRAFVFRVASFTLPPPRCAPVSWCDWSRGVRASLRSACDCVLLLCTPFYIFYPPILSLFPLLFSTQPPSLSTDN